MDLRVFQHQVQKWTERNFPDHRQYQPLLGIMEELGELAHAHLKGEQGIRHTPEEIQAMKIDAVGDIVVFLADYCNMNGIILEEDIRDTWQKVMQREWTARGIVPNVYVVTPEEPRPPRDPEDIGIDV